jgi:hypothetical protein
MGGSPYIPQVGHPVKTLTRHEKRRKFVGFEKKIWESPDQYPALI